MNPFSNVLGICSFLGTAGYNYHARGFFTALNKYLPVAIKNWSYDADPYYLTNEQKAMMASVSGSSYTPGSCITICLHETNHEDWYKNTFKSPKIAFNVWESTRQPQQFFDKLLEFDQIWVPSKWQKDCTIEQGAPADKIFVIPEGFDTERFKVRNCDVIAKFSSPSKFTFLLAGRWEYRKATTEIIRTFINTFKGQDDVELLLLVDNPFDRQRLSTEDKITKYGLQDDKIKIIHKLSQEDYDILLQETDCFLSCSRAEGWNLPLCFPVGTEVITPTGFRSIETIDRGDDVFSHKGISRKVREVMQREYRGNLINVDIYSNINTLSATPEHPVRVIKRDRLSKMYGGSLLEYIQKRGIEPEWIPIKDIKKGDLLVQGIPETIYSNKVIDLLDYVSDIPGLSCDSEFIWSKFSNNPRVKGSRVKKVKRFIELYDLAYLLGWYLAEGNSYKTRVTFSLNSITERNIAFKIGEEVFRLFGIDSSFQDIDGKDVLNVRVSSSIISTFFRNYCGGNQKYRFIPNEVLYGDLNTLRVVMSGLFLGDGCHTGNRSELATCSVLLANQVVIALERLGYRAGSQKVKRNRKVEHYLVSLIDNLINGSHSNKKYLVNNEVWHFVKKVTETFYEGTVYNFEVEEDNSYLTHIASVHNCEAMACGIPSICSNWSGQLEFAASHANLVENNSLKPVQSEFGVFPGNYIEPDFRHLGDTMRDIISHYSDAKKIALEGAEYLKEYTWDNAAQIALKAIKKLEEDYKFDQVEQVESDKGESPINGIVLPHTVKFVKPEAKEKKEVKPKYRSKDIFVIDCYPNTTEKMEKLAKTVISIKERYDKPIAVVSHLEISKEVHSNIDYYIYDADNTLPDYRLPVVYTFENLKLTGRLDRPYHSLPIIKSLQNVCKMFSNFERIHFLEYDINVDLDKHLSNVADHKDKDLVSYYYEGTGIYTNIMSFHPSFMLDILTTRTITWDEYKRMIRPLWEQDLIFENWIYKLLTIAKKNDNVAILNASSVDMRKDSFKEMPKYNVIFSELDDNSNYIMFIVHRGMNSKNFRVYFSNHANLPYKMDLTDCEDYSYVIFDREIGEVNLLVGQHTDPPYVMTQQTMGEFIFYDREIKCKEIDRLKSMNTGHNVQIKNFFIDGGFVELLGPDSPDKYAVTFTDRLTGQVVLKSDIGINCWTRTNRKYFTDWNVKVACGDTEIYNADISYFQRRVMIVLDSKAMGDTLAWFPMVEEFRKKHNAQIIVVTYWNKFFKDKYPDIEFAEPGSVVPDIFAQFNVGCFDNDLNKNKFNWRITPLQKVAADQLGMSPWKEGIPNISFQIKDRPIKEKYAAISEHSTFLSKYWLHEGGWSTVIKYLNDRGYKVAAISRENTEQHNVISLTGRPIEETLNNIHHADLFIGMSSGPSWLSWALRKPLVLISGYSTKWAEMDPNNPLVARVINEDVCHGCFNDPSLPLERGNWRWCPRGRDFECSKMISPDMVIAAIDKLL